MKKLITALSAFVVATGLLSGIALGGTCDYSGTWKLQYSISGESVGQLELEEHGHCVANWNGNDNACRWRENTHGHDLRVRFPSGVVYDGNGHETDLNTGCYTSFSGIIHGSGVVGTWKIWR